MKKLTFFITIILAAFLITAVSNADQDVVVTTLTVDAAQNYNADTAVTYNIQDPGSYKLVITGGTGAKIGFADTPTFAVHGRLHFDAPIPKHFFALSGFHGKYSQYKFEASDGPTKLLYLMISDEVIWDNSGTVEVTLYKTK